MTDQLNNFSELKEIHASLAERFREAIVDSKFEKNELSVKIKMADILPVLFFLKREKGFTALNDMIALDNLSTMNEGSKRFSILYQVYRFSDHQRLRVIIDLDEGETADSIYSVYKSSDWNEREIFDMFGISFNGHPGLKRIYMPDDYSGFPLRKDFPLEG